MYNMVYKLGLLIIRENEKEKTNFFIKNKKQNYNEIILTEQRRIRINKMLDVLAHSCVVGASILGTLIYIQNN